MFMHPIAITAVNSNQNSGFREKAAQPRHWGLGEGGIVQRWWAVVSLA
jgi:hypothetical protein